MMLLCNAPLARGLERAARKLPYAQYQALGMCTRPSQKHAHAHPHPTGEGLGLQSELALAEA